MSKYELNPKATQSEKNRYATGVLGGEAAALGGGAIYGHRAGNIGAAQSIKQAASGTKVGVRGSLRNLGHGYKAATRTRQGKVGLAIGAAGAITSGVAAHRAKQKGVVVPKAVQKSLSAFGVDHGIEKKWTRQDTKNVAYLGAGGAAGGLAARKLTRGSRVGTAAGAGLGIMGGASAAGRKHAKAFRREYRRKGLGYEKR